MKRLNKLKILGIALVLIIAGTFAVTRIQEHTEKIKTGGGTILEISGDSVSKISWTSESGSLAFHKDGDDWVCDDDEEFPVDNNSINSRIADFADFQAAFTIEDADDLSQYGLENPVSTINMTAGDDEYEIKLGDYSSIDEQRYVSVGDGNVYLAETDPYDDFNVSVDTLMKDDEIPYSFSDDVSVSFDGAYTYSFGYEEDNKYTGCSDDVYFTTSKHLALDTEKVESYLSDISYIGLGTCMTYKATDDDLEKYGLNDPELSVTIDYKDSDDEDQTLAFTVGRKMKDRDEDRKSGKNADKDADENADDSDSGSDDEDGDASDEADDSDDSDDTAAYFKMEGSSIIYEISATDFENIMAGSYSDLRHDDIFTSDTEDVYKMEVKLDGKSYTFESKGSGDDKKWYLDDEEVDAAPVVDALSSITAKEYTDSAETGKEEISVTAYMKNKNVDKMSFVFCRNDGESCTAKVNGAVRCTVSRSDVVDLVEAVNAVIL